MSGRRISAVLAAAFLAGCATGLGTDPAAACHGALRAADQDLESARNEGLGASLDFIKAANLLSAAHARMQVEKYDSCLDKVRRARGYLRAVTTQR